MGEGRGGGSIRKPDVINFFNSVAARMMSRFEEGGYGGSEGSDIFVEIYFVSG